jgi:molybdopterin-containing oxidoreductase family membrane subunit
LPDLATMRDMARTRLRRIVYGIFALGWRGSAHHWHDFKMANLLLGGLATPLVLSVHTIVSFDFAVSLLPGWHATIFPPYFVAGAVFSGFAMVITLIVPARRFMGLKDVITEKHLENMTKVILATGLMVSYGYLMEHFIAWYSGDPFERFVFWDRRAGFYRYIYFTQMFCNVLVPQIFWFRRFRYNIAAIWIAALFIQIGMWTERFMIVVQSLHKDFLPSSWGYYAPTWVDWGLLLGTISFFGTAFLVFLRYVPAVALAEVKEINHELAGRHAGAGR